MMQWQEKLIDVDKSLVFESVTIPSGILLRPERIPDRDAVTVTPRRSTITEEAPGERISGLNLNYLK